MVNKRKASPLQASFWLTDQEKRYILVICAIFLLGLVVRYWYLNNGKPREYDPRGLDKLEEQHE